MITSLYQKIVSFSSKFGRKYSQLTTSLKTYERGQQVAIPCLITICMTTMGLLKTVITLQDFIYYNVYISDIMFILVIQLMFISMQQGNVYHCGDDLHVLSSPMGKRGMGHQRMTTLRIYTSMCVLSLPCLSPWTPLWHMQGHNSIVPG